LLMALPSCACRPGNSAAPAEDLTLGAPHEQRSFPMADSLQTEVRGNVLVMTIHRP
jgi:hypothetical protein